MLESGNAGDDLPETLQGLVAARIDGLPAAAKELLQDAAVLGKVFWSDALRDLSALDGSELDEQLRLLERQEFVRRERRSAVEGARQYVFLHAIVREAAYGQIPRAARSLKHRRTAEWIAALPPDRGEDRAETLAHHLESAMSYGQAAGLEVDDLRPQLIHALRDAGDRARALNIVSRSVVYYRRAIEAGPDHPDPELAWLYAEASMWAEGVEGGTQPLEEACELLLVEGRNDLAALAMTLLDRALWNASKADLSLLDRALELVADTGPTSLRGRVISAVAVRWAIAGRPDEALPLAREALEIARAHGDRDAEVEALNNVAVSQVNGGDLEGGRATAQACLALALECGARDLPRPYVNLATFEYDMGNRRGRRRVPPRRPRARRAPREQGERGLVGSRARDRPLRARPLGRGAAAMPGSLQAVGANAGHCTTSTRSSGSSRRRSWLARDGHLPAGLIGEVLEQARSIGDPQIVEPALGQATALWLVTGHADRARACLAEYRDVRQGGTSIFSRWATSPVIRTRVAAAVERPRARRPAGRPCRAPGLGRHDSSLWERPADAAEILASIGARTIEADVRLHAARLLTESDPAEAVRQLDLATAFWRSVGATARLAQVDDVRRLLREEAS